MKRWLVFLLGVGVFSSTIPAALPAIQDRQLQDPFESSRPRRTGEKETIQKKAKGWLFHRPAKDTAAAQLEYADSLLAQDKKKAAMKAYSALVHEWHDSPEAPKAQLALAKALEDVQKYTDAFDEYQYLITFYAGQFKYDEVLDRQFRIANEIMTARHWKILFFPGYTAPDNALPLFQKIMENARHWSKADQVQFNIGLINEENGDYAAALAAYEDIQSRYSGSSFAEEASFRRAHCLYLLAKSSARDETSCRNALSALAAFVADYPRSNNITGAQRYLEELKERLADMYYERAMFYDKIARRPASALIAYSAFIRNFPTSRRTAEVADRMDAIRNELERKTHDK